MVGDWPHVVQQLSFWSTLAGRWFLGEAACWFTPIHNLNMNFMPLNSLQTSPKLTLAPAKWTAKSENSNLETSFISRFPWIFSLGLQEKSSPRHSPTKLPTSRVWMWNAVALHRSFHVVCPTKLTWTLEIMLAYGFPKLESRISGDPPFFSSQGQLYLQEWYFWFQVALPKRNGLVKLRGGYFGMP